MFLSWDVPASRETIEVAGFTGGEEVCRHKVKAAGKPSKIHAVCDSDVLKADGRDITHIEISIVDSNGVFNPVAANTVTVTVEGAAELIGIDNGMPDSHESLKGTTMKAGGGLLLAIVRAKREPGSATITITSEGLKQAAVELSIV
jgi:beta-galactosidase